VIDEHRLELVKRNISLCLFFRLLPRFLRLDFNFVRHFDSPAASSLQIRVPYKVICAKLLYWFKKCVRHVVNHIMTLFLASLLLDFVEVFLDFLCERSALFLLAHFLVDYSLVLLAPSLLVLGDHVQWSVVKEALAHVLDERACVANQFARQSVDDWARLFVCETVAAHNLNSECNCQNLLSQGGLSTRLRA
jgi:hypothetical protein